MDISNVESIVGVDDINLLSLEDRIQFLSKPGALQAQLAELDGKSKLKRIFLMGCGRSGTWLLLSLMSTFSGVMVLAHEVPVETFGLVSTDAPALVLKREWKSHQSVEHIPEDIHILYIIRHPYDVLTSNNPMTNETFHISPERWSGEMRALHHLIDSKRRNVIIVRYEDLASQPTKIQAHIASSLGLSAAATPTEIMRRVKLPPQAVSAMHGVRDFDGNSIGRFRKNAQHMEYLRSLKPILSKEFEWVGRNFGYNLDL